MITIWYEEDEEVDISVEIPAESEESFSKTIGYANKTDEDIFVVVVDGDSVSVKPIVRVDDDDEIVYMHPSCEIKSDDEQESSVVGWNEIEEVVYNTSLLDFDKEKGFTLK